MPYVQRDFANVILCVAFRQQGLVGIAFRIDTYVLQLLVFEVEDSCKIEDRNSNVKDLLYR